MAIRCGPRKSCLVVVVTFRKANALILDPGLGKIVEIGNSGMFRPEMLEAMGLP